MTKPFSGSDYRKHAQAVRQAAPTETVTLKSGAVFELRRPDLQGYVITGRVPSSLLAEGLAAWQKAGKAPIPPDEPKPDDVVDQLIFMREIVREVCVMPKFVELANAADEIGAADMLPGDFAEIFQWAMTGQGVTGPDGLQQFRQGPAQRIAALGANGKRQRRARKQPVTN